MKISEEIDLLTQTKKWNELTAEERKLVEAEIGGESSYGHLRTVFFAIEEREGIALRPKQETLDSLKKAFRKHHQRDSLIAVVFSMKVPVFASIVLTAILCAAAWYFGRTSMPPVKPTTITLEKTDTVFVTRPDTITLTRVVYKTVYKDRPVVAAVTAKKSDYAKGVSMKEKEELDNFLVSGTR
ncbi:MAG TPA: hypothetical protein VD927_08510 [Chryseosolibacter sp.]|nr:hypothetical protein [Chryseosolibacter sp.]